MSTCLGRAVGVTLLLTVAAVAPALPQCPDGTPPPCADQRRRAAPPHPPRSPVYRQVTSTGGWHTPALSPDGRFLLFRSQFEGYRLRLQALTPGARAAVVFDSVDMVRNGRPYAVMWSADADRIFVHGDSAILSVPVMGGAAQTLWRRPAPEALGLASPTGDRVIWADPRARAIVVHTLATGRLDTVPVPGDLGTVSSTTWSPDGQALVFPTSDSELRHTLRVLRLRTRTSRVILRDSLPLRLGAWSATARAIYYQRMLRTMGLGRYQLWRLPVSPAGVPTGPPRLVLPLVEGQHFSLAETGTMAFDRTTERANIRISAASGDTTARWLTTGTSFDRRPLFSPDGRQVAFVREDAAAGNLWVSPSDSSAPEQLTFLETGVVFNLAWSPDGRRIAFCQIGEGGAGLGVVTVATRELAWPRTLSMSAPCQVAWLSDDEVLYWRPSRTNFGIVSLSGVRPARHLVADDSAGEMRWPRADPSGRRVAIWWDRARSGGAGIWLISLADSSVRRLRAGGGTPLRWSPAGDTLYATVWPPLRYAGIPLAAPDSLVDTHTPTLQGCLDGDVSPDATKLLCAQWKPGSGIDVWLVEDFDPEWPSPAPRPRR